MPFRGSFTDSSMTAASAFSSALLIIGLEFTNSTVERIMNLEEPEISKSVKHIKDMAAAGVLVASIFAAIVGIAFVIRHLPF